MEAFWKQLRVKPWLRPATGGCLGVLGERSFPILI
jgi:hypothetical protein